MAISGALFSGFIKDVFYIRTRDALNAKLNYKYLSVTIKGNKEEVIMALTAKARLSKYCPYCGQLVWERREGMGRLGDTASLDRIYGDTEIDSEKTQFICDLCNSGKSVLTPNEYIKRAFSIVFHVSSEAISNNMTVEEFINSKWPETKYD